jgi:tripartite-type tricarboxylate transporter receptor subunit TctC
MSQRLRIGHGLFLILALLVAWGAHAQTYPAKAVRVVIGYPPGAGNDVMQTPGMRERFAALGAESMTGTPREWAVYVRSEAAKWAKVIKAAGVKPE